MSKPTLQSESQASNLCLQICLHYNVYCAGAWALVYAWHIVYNLHSLWSFEGSFVLIAFVVALVAESTRIYCGYAANLCMQSALLIIFLTLTPCIMLPALLFLRFVAKSQIALITGATALLLLFMALECIAGVYTYMQFYKQHAAQQHQTEAEHDASAALAHVPAPTTSQRRMKERNNS